MSNFDIAKQEPLYECAACTEFIRQYVKDFVGAFYTGDSHDCVEYQREALEKLPEELRA
jgi:hypothetical protein